MIKFSQPLRRALLRKRLRSLDIILRGRHRLHRGVFALLGDRPFQRDFEAFWIACLEARIDIGEFLQMVSAQRSAVAISSACEPLR